MTPPIIIVSIIIFLLIVRFIIKRDGRNISDSFSYTNKYGNELLRDIKKTKVDHQNVIKEILSPSVTSCLRGDVARLTERFDALNLNFIKSRQTILKKEGEPAIIVLEGLMRKIHWEIAILRKINDNLYAE